MSQNPGEFFPQNGLFSLFSMLVCIRSSWLDRRSGSSIQASIVPNGSVGAIKLGMARPEARICDGYRKSGLGSVAGASVISRCSVARPTPRTRRAARMPGSWQRSESVKDKICQRHAPVRSIGQSSGLARGAVPDDARRPSSFPRVPFGNSSAGGRQKA